MGTRFMSISEKDSLQMDACMIGAFIFTKEKQNKVHYST